MSFEELTTARPSQAWVGRICTAVACCALSCGGEVPIGEPGPPGDQGPPGKNGGDTPSVSAVLPGSVFLGRQQEIVISGFGTNWGDGATVDFGEGVNVDEVVVASPTALVVQVTVADTAPMGVRDVDVSGEDGSLSYAGAFKVAAPLDITGVQGSVAQGSIVVMRAQQRDVTTPFDTTELVDGSYPYLALLYGSAPGIVRDATPYTLEGLLLVDVEAATGPSQLAVQSGTGASVLSVQPDAIDVEPRTAQPLVANAAAVGSVTVPYASQLYRLDIPENSVGWVSVQSPNSAALPAMVVLDAGGSFANRLAYTPQWFHKTGGDMERYYLVYWDGSGSAGYNYAINYALEGHDEIEPNDSCGDAQSLGSVPVQSSNLSLSSSDDEDWFRLTVAAEDVGASLVINTMPGEIQTDTYLEVYTGNCNTLFGAGSDDSGFHDELVTPPLTNAGSYYLRVVNSPDYPYAGALYDLSVMVQ